MYVLSDLIVILNMSFFIILSHFDHLLSINVYVFSGTMLFLCL